jgi:hypothetical protein
MMDTGRRFHDMGGQPAGPLFPSGNREEHEFEDWERRVDAMMSILSRANKVRIDEIRRTLEDLGETVWKMSYYERWLYAITQNLIARGHLSIDEVGRIMEKIGDAPGAAGKEKHGSR